MSKKFLQKKLAVKKRKMSVAKENEKKKFQIKMERRENALTQIPATIDLDKIQAMHQNIDSNEMLEDLEKLAELKSTFFGNGDK